MMKNIDRTFCVAPMMDWSDRHCRMFWRQFSRRALLYTEMVTSAALLHAGPERFLDFDEAEHPLALQLGGSDPRELAECARMAEQWGFDEVNLNCGCPSDRVQSGSFGACLMAQPALVADCVKAMRDACSLPATVKHRIGIDEMEGYGPLCDFIEPIRQAGCETFIVHARKAWLQGLSPKQNREIPPLDYPLVYRLKRDFPELEIIMNGGIDTLEQCDQHLAHTDGVMLGRAAYNDPWLLAAVDRHFFGDDPFGDSRAPSSREQALLDFLPYIDRQLAQGVALNHITRHILGLFQGVPGARLFRRHISENAHLPGAGVEVVEAALNLMQSAQQRSAPAIG